MSQRVLVDRFGYVSFECWLNQRRLSVSYRKVGSVVADFAWSEHRLVLLSRLNASVCVDLAEEWQGRNPDGFDCSTRWICLHGRDELYHWTIHEIYFPLDGSRFGHWQVELWVQIYHANCVDSRRTGCSSELQVAYGKTEGFDLLAQKLAANQLELHEETCAVESGSLGTVPLFQLGCVGSLFDVVSPEPWREEFGNSD
jgi:hypothetical protein